MKNYAAIHERIGVAKKAAAADALTSDGAMPFLNLLTAVVIQVERLTKNGDEKLNDAVFGEFLAILDGVTEDDS